MKKAVKKLKKSYSKEESRHDKAYEKENSKHENKHTKELNQALEIGKGKCKEGGKSDKKKR